MSPEFTGRFLKTGGGIELLLIASSAYLALVRLDNTPFWDDESQVGLIARNLIRTGKLTGGDGRNLLTFRNGTLLDANLRPIDPPLQYLVAAASFALAGASTWAGRLPFALIGWAGLIVFRRVLHQTFRQEPVLRLYSLATLALSVVFLLNIRQCRYYSLVLFSSLLTYSAYRAFLISRRWRYSLLLGLAAIVLFYSNYLLCTAFLLSLAVGYLVFARKDRHRADYVKLAGAVGVFLVATVPYALHFRIWHRPDSPAGEYSYFQNALLLLWWNLRDLNLITAIPWTIALALTFFLLRHRRSEGTRVLVEWVGLVLGYVVFLAAFSRQRADVTTMADVRYLITALPFLAGLVGAFLGFVHRRRPLLAGALCVVVLTSNVLTLLPGWQFRWLLPAYVGEVHRDYPTACREVVRFLETHAAQDDLVFAFPEYNNYPLMFYVGDKVRICCTLDRSSPIPVERVRSLNAPYLIDENFPDWLIAFGGDPSLVRLLQFFSRPHVRGGRSVRLEYSLFRVIDVYCLDTSRPELPWHRFVPIKDFDRNREAVYVFRASTVRLDPIAAIGNSRP